ncbi:ankyrin repeat domain-containing protein [Mucilaginibacter sp.]|uniref:ankyrin repeat domain-containing protein n=1 Tax=Mucilaginibacter sp. TaxID=1882438 RepID=UPI00260447EC|nr:ankyrin repeat domain-containing protein [Mucilaginibacter sp.]MDB4920056.1 Ankyrin repeat-containing protein [Mucilaginibacter sp.]
MAVQDIPIPQKEAAGQAAVQGDVAALEHFLKQYHDHPDLRQHYSAAGFNPENGNEDNAKRIIAHTHYFNTWAEYERFQTHLQNDLALRHFEQAADAIFSGDTATLKALLEQNPELITARSVRNHHSTLLNYVGANGFEGYRQKTPKNAMEIAEILLAAGAEVDAWGDMYRGASTLGLVATSVHPVITGVQKELMDLLIRHGADPNHAVAPDYTDGNLILACLHNGRGEPVKYLAGKGAEVDLEGAGGVGDLEKVKSYFSGGRLTDQKMEPKRDGCLMWACEYGHLPIVHYLLGTGMNVNTSWNGTTPLHSAAFGGQTAIVRLLLEKGAAMEALNAYDGTVLGTTIWAFYNNRKPAHPEIMETLIAAGAQVKDDWQVYINDIRSKT